jgi:hypothetical protein
MGSGRARPRWRINYCVIFIQQEQVYSKLIMNLFLLLAFSSNIAIQQSGPVFVTWV